VLAATLALVMTLTPALAQTRITPPKNNYSAAQDVQLGNQAAAEVQRQMPLLPNNSEVDAYVERVGQRLVAAIPPQYQFPEFQYRFGVVNARDINAFALPGGPMFVNRGMIEAARTEGEMAGVMAHEISHVALRHGTAQASRQSKFQLPAIGAAVLGAIIGGNLGGVIAQGTQLGLSAYLLKFSREYERQADLLGAQIMARAGYDPRDLANMFQIIERESGGRSGGPEWLSSHPNPGNRYEAITREAQLLRIQPSRTNSYDFQRVQASLRQLSPAPSMQEIAQGAARGGQNYPPNYPSDAQISTRVEMPSPRYQTYNGGNVFRIAVPDNWQTLGSESSVTFSPRGAYANYQGQSVFTHGAMVGVIQVGTNDLDQASRSLISSLLQNNQYLQPARNNFQRGSLSGRQALQLPLVGTSPVTRRSENVTITTTMLNNGQLFYIISVVPSNEARAYNRTFNDMLGSLQLNG
jgi:Zn-dependent protease with chaperone function